MALRTEAWHHRNGRAVVAYMQEQIALALAHERAATERLALRSAQSAREGAQIAEAMRESAARGAARRAEAKRIEAARQQRLEAERRRVQCFLDEQHAAADAERRRRAMEERPPPPPEARRQRLEARKGWQVAMATRAAAERAARDAADEQASSARRLLTQAHAAAHVRDEAGRRGREVQVALTARVAAANRAADERAHRQVVRRAEELDGADGCDAADAWRFGGLGPSLHADLAAATRRREAGLRAMATELAQGTQRAASEAEERRQEVDSEALEEYEEALREMAEEKCGDSAGTVPSCAIPSCAISSCAVPSCAVLPARNACAILACAAPHRMLGLARWPGVVLLTGYAVRPADGVRCSVSRYAGRNSVSARRQPISGHPTARARQWTDPEIGPPQPSLLLSTPPLGSCVQVRVGGRLSGKRARRAPAARRRRLRSRQPAQVQAASLGARRRAEEGGAWCASADGAGGQ